MRPIFDLSIDDLEKIFKDYPLYSQEEKKNPYVIVEFYIPNQNIYWLITEGSKENNDFVMFGYCRITDGELGYVSFNEMQSVTYSICYVIHDKEKVTLNQLKIKYDES